MNTITLGRRPTLGEVVEYYTQASFLYYLLDTLRRRRVVLVISERKHWEPNWEKDEVVGEDVTSLRRFIERKIEAHLPEVGVNDRPEFYPAFHQSVRKGPGGEGPHARSQHMDCIFEADMPTWRDSFQDVSAVISLFERYGVPYQHKFSGHRSLHIVIPGEIIPPGYRGKSTRKLAGALLGWSSSQGHHLPRITRMPYSLNEDSGLACLPIERGELSAFRPWQANLHLVDVPETSWDLKSGEEDQARLAKLIGDLTSEAPEQPSRKPTPERLHLTIENPRDILDRYRDRLTRLKGSGAIGHAWAQLAGDAPMTQRDLLEGLSQDDPDATWLSAEAYVFHGTGIPPKVFDGLLAQHEEYTRASAIDALLRFEAEILPMVAAAIEELSSRAAIGSDATYLLTQSPSLRQAVFDTLVANAEGAHETRLVVACSTGAVSNDWAAARQLIEPLRTDQDLPPQERARLRRRIRAIEMMSTLDEWNRRAIAREAQRLAALGPGITDLLLIAANSPEPRFRRAIVSALAFLADPRATDMLIRALNDDYTKVRRQAVMGLVRIGEPAVAALIAAADSDQASIRRYAILCLSRIATSSADVAALAKPTIVDALWDNEEAVRRTAIRSMAKLATPADLKILTAYIRDASPEHAIEAAEIIEGLGVEGTEALRQMAITERIPAAAYFIARQGDHRGTEILVEQLQDDDRRDAAVEFLRELRDPRCVPYLIEQVRAATDWRGGWLAQELGAIGGKEAVNALIETLSRDAAMMRRGAVRGLDQTGDPVAIPALIDVLEDPDRKVRRLAAETLEHYGEPAVRGVRKALAGTEAQNGRRRSILLQVLTKLENQLGTR